MGMPKKIPELIGELPDFQLVASNLALAFIPPVTWRSHLQQSAHSFLNNSEKDQICLPIPSPSVLTIDEMQNHTEVRQYVLPQ